MNPEPIKKIAEFDASLRVDRVGPFQSESTNVLKVLVQFSGIKEQYLENPYISEALTGEGKSIVFDLSFLTRLKVGTIWKFGRLVRSADYVGEFQVDTEDVKFVQLGKKFDLEGRTFDSPIPDNFFPSSSNKSLSSDTWYAIVKISDNQLQKYLIIPCIELIRFFYGVSSRLLKKILCQELDLIVDMEKSNLIDSISKLHVKTKLSRLEALVLSRGVSSDSDKRLLRNPGKQIATLKLANSTRREGQPEVPLTVKFKFPFTGNTSLKVAGKRTKLVSTGNAAAPIWVINVMEILECPKPFGLNFPEIFHEDCYLSNTNTYAGSGPGFPDPTPFIPEDLRDKPISDSQVNARYKRVSIATDFNPFPGSELIRFSHTWSQQKGINRSFPVKTDSDVEVEERSVGKGSYEQDSVNRIGVDFYLTQIQNTNRKLEEFVFMLSHLRKNLKEIHEKFEIDVRTFDARATPYACFPSDIIERRKWLSIYENGSFRNRYVVIAELSLNTRKSESQRFLYLLEMELKPTELGFSTLIMMNNGLERISDNDLKAYLNLSAVKRGWLFQRSVFSAKETKNFEQYRETAGKLQKRLKFDRIPHSSTIKDKSNKTLIKEMHGKSINPMQWGTYILEALQKQFPAFFD